MSRKQLQDLLNLSLITSSGEKILREIQNEPIAEFETIFNSKKKSTTRKRTLPEDSAEKKKRKSVRIETRPSEFQDKVLKAIKAENDAPFALPWQKTRNTAKGVTRSKKIGLTAEIPISQPQKKKLQFKIKNSRFAEYERYRHSPENFFRKPDVVRRRIIANAFKEVSSLECFGCLARFNDAYGLSTHVGLCEKFQEDYKRLVGDSLIYCSDDEDDDNPIHQPLYYHNLIRHGENDQDVWNRYLHLMSRPAYYFYLDEDLAIDICRAVVPIYRKITGRQDAQTPCLLYSRCGQAFTSPTTLHYHMIDCFAENAPDLRNCQGEDDSETSYTIEKVSTSQREAEPEKGEFDDVLRSVQKLGSVGSDRSVTPVDLDNQVEKTSEASNSPKASPKKNDEQLFTSAEIIIC